MQQIASPHKRSCGMRRAKSAHRLGKSDEGGAAGLGEAVALAAWSAHGSLEKLLNVARQGGSPAAHQPHSAPQLCPHLVKHQRIRQRRRLRQELQCPSVISSGMLQRLGQYYQQQIGNCRHHCRSPNVELELWSCGLGQFTHYPHSCI